MSAVQSPASPPWTWPLPPRVPVLGAQDVHVWGVLLEVERAAVQAFEQTLSADERSRAGRFHFSADRERFIVARGLLRAILASYLQTSAGDLRFDYNPNGKPALAAARPEGGGIEFNLAHSHDRALYAVTRGRRVGVDLERLDAPLADARVAEQFFAPREVAALRALPLEGSVPGFFACWTRKEAYVKARGQGLAIPLDRFEVTVTPGDPVTLTGDDEPGLGARWSITDLSVWPAYAAALAVEGQRDWRLGCWRWPG